MPRTPVTIVCVCNDIPVRRACLDRSIADHLVDAPATEYLPIDNTTGTFATAGAALNHGVRSATNDVVVFVHQDVYLHSLVALEEAAATLQARPEIGLHGAVGITSEGTIAGRTRDRVVFIGEPAHQPVEVDSLDEVLFMATRATMLDEPLVEEPDLAWHAYAVEYGVRMRSQGRIVTAGDIPLTHNSISVNLARLEEAHCAVGRRFPDALPVQTTCGVVSGGEPVARRFAAHRWRYTWLKESRVAHLARRAAGGGRVVLSDIRMDVDEVITGAEHPLRVLNREADGRAVGAFGDELDLARAAQQVTVVAMDLAGIEEALAQRSTADAPLLITNLDVSDLRRLAARLPREGRLIGYHHNHGCWVLLGEPAARATGEPWTSPRAVPLGMARLSPG